MKLKSGTKTKLENIQPAQWTVANARILGEMISQIDGDIRQLTLDYLSYTAKIGEYGTRFT